MLNLLNKKDNFTQQNDGKFNTLQGEMVRQIEKAVTYWKSSASVGSG